MPTQQAMPFHFRSFRGFPLGGVLFFCMTTLFFTGCPAQKTEPNKTEAKPFQGVKLRLTVVDDSTMAGAIRRLAGEWNAQTESELQVEQATAKDLEAASALESDIVIAPSSLLGPLAEKDLVASVPENVQTSSDWSSIFDLLKLREAAWGKDASGASKGNSAQDDRIKAVPFGSPVFVCYYRADLLQKSGHQPPQTWSDYFETAKALAAQKPEGSSDWCGAVEPLSPGWAGLTLLARAASCAKHRDNYSTLFKIDTMEPLLTSPAFVLALEELVAAAKFGPSDPLAFDPAGVRAAFWKGQCALAITWPSAAQDEKAGADSANAEAAIKAGIVELPGSAKVYNRETQKWDVRSEEDEMRVPLLGIAGRLGMVSKQSNNTEAAFRLLLWLSDPERSLQVSAASPNTTLFSRSQIPVINRWVEKTMSGDAAGQYAAITEKTLCREQWLTALPLPGRAEYLAALDDAVRAAVRGEKKPEAALQDAAAQWNKITEKLGLEKQRTAYQHSLGW